MINGEKDSEVETGEEEEKDNIPKILTREEKRALKGLTPLLSNEEKNRTRRGFKRSVGTANIEKVYSEPQDLIGPKSNSLTGISTSLSPDKKPSTKTLNLLSIG